MDPVKAGKYYELAAYQAGLFSKDPHTQVAAILLAPDSLQILSTGFNGICRKLCETPERWTRPAKYKWVAHAEMNAICNAARGGVRVESSICVVTLFPCVDCCKALIQAGISAVVTKTPDLDCQRWGPDFRISAEMLREAGVRIMYVET